MKKVLLTGFDPFGGDSVNPSWEAVSHLQYKLDVGAQIEVRQLPTVFRKSMNVLWEALNEERPDIVICVGQAGGRSGISIERVAINIIDASIPDNEGNQPVDEPIWIGAPTAYWSSLPIKLIEKNICNAGIPAMISQSAGTFVCNHLFYGLNHMIETEFPSVIGGFIHIPFLPEQTVKRPDVPSMSLENVIKALEVAVITCVEFDNQGI